jgi:hypothetical protein
MLDFFEAPIFRAGFQRPPEKTILPQTGGNRLFLARVRRDRIDKALAALRDKAK